jgi:hypothetical protein
VCKKSGFGSGMNNPDLISESLKTIKGLVACCHSFYLFLHCKKSLKTSIWVKNASILLCGSGIRDGKKSDPVSRINFPNPQHWINLRLLVTSPKEVLRYICTDKLIISRFKQQFF